MRYKWREKDANLDDLAEKIEAFMKNNGFKVTRIKNNGYYQVFGVLRTSEGKFRTLMATLSKTSEGLEIELKHGNFTHSILKFSFLFSMFGGGVLLLDAYKSSEFYQEIEEKFWDYIQEELSKNVNS
ncbi:MAG: hypothetical protein QW670_03670 [Candidatus Bathyarchaeia archaeon]